MADLKNILKIAAVAGMLMLWTGVAAACPMHPKDNGMIQHQAVTTAWVYNNNGTPTMVGNPERERPNHEPGDVDTFFLTAAPQGQKVVTNSNNDNGDEGGGLPGRFPQQPIGLKA
jgi:hypothetical protein